MPSPCCQVVEFPDASGPLEFSYDEEWLAILKATHSLMNLQRRPWPMPAVAPAPSEAEVEAVQRRLQQRGGYLGGWARGCRVSKEELTWVGTLYKKGRWACRGGRQCVLVSSRE